MMGRQQPLLWWRINFQRRTLFQQRTQVSQSQTRSTPTTPIPSPSLWRLCGRPLSVLVVFILGLSRVNRIPWSVEPSARESKLPLAAAGGVVEVDIDSSNTNTNNHRQLRQPQGQQPKSSSSTNVSSANTRSTSALPSAHVTAMSSSRPKPATLSSTTMTTTQTTFTAGLSGCTFAAGASSLLFTSSRTTTGVVLQGWRNLPRSRMMPPGKGKGKENNISTPPTDSPNTLLACPSPIRPESTATTGVQRLTSSPPPRRKENQPIFAVTKQSARSDSTCHSRAK